MSKEKSTKTQSRKKQTTDVSDALFHVTPQPSIDIFEVLGGAINVQTAAFLTGKTDLLEPSTPAPAVHEALSHAEPIAQAGSLALDESIGAHDENISPAHHTSNQHHSQSDNVALTGPHEATQLQKNPDEVAAPKATSGSIPSAASKAASGSMPTAMPIQHDSPVMEIQDVPESTLDMVSAPPNKPTDAPHTPAHPQSTQMPASAPEAPLSAQSSIQAPHGSAMANVVSNPAFNETSAPTLSDTTPQEYPTISATSEHPRGHIDAIHGDKSHATSYDNMHSTDTSTAAHDTRISMLHSQTAISHASPQTAHHASMKDSTATPSHHSAQHSIEQPHSNSTPIAPVYEIHTSQGSPYANSTQYIIPNSPAQYPTEQQAQAPIYRAQNPQVMASQGPNLLSQLTKREEELLQFLRHHHGQIVSYSQMLKALNWRESQRCTARNIVARFEANGIINRQRIQGTRSQGYLFTMCDQDLTQPMPQNMVYAPYTIKNQVPNNPNSYGYSTQNSIPQNTPIPSSPQAYYPHGISTETSTHTITNQGSQYSTHPNPQTISQTSTHSYIDKIDRLIQSIWQSDQETIMACWPAAAAAGLRSAHLRQLESIFDLQGFEVGTVSLALRYLDWQLEQGPLTNARGELIEDPIAYWLSSMRRHGYYSRPKGYVDPLLEAKRLLAEEEQSKADMQARLMQARQESEAAQEEQRSEALFGDLIRQGQAHPLWPMFYQSLPLMFRQKVDAEGPQALAKKFSMVKALVKELL